MVGMMKMKSRLDTHIVKNIQNLRSFSLTDLLQLWEVQNNLLKDEDRLIEQFAAQLSEYEQELHEKDAYISELESELRRTLNSSKSKEELL
jgi:hypothetical protein